MELGLSQKQTELTLYRSALEYLEVINITQQSDNACPQTPFGFIASLITELALKAFLFKQGKSERALTKIGHNLVKAWSTSVGLGLPISQEVPQWCVLLNDAYDRPHLARYSKTNIVIVSSPQHEVRQAINNLVHLVGQQLDLNENFV